MLIEVECILNSKTLGYVSSDIADPDPITLNLLLMGRRDSSLPQVVYGPSNLLGRRRYRHSQVIADHFWTQFLRNYLPRLTHAQVELVQTCLVRIKFSVWQRIQHRRVIRNFLALLINLKSFFSLVWYCCALLTP